MSEYTAAAAVDTALLTQTDYEEIGFDMYALLEVIGFDYERWCRIVGMDPDDDVTESIFWDAHRTYMKAWKTLGDEFGKRTQPYVSKWERLLNVKPPARRR